MAQRLSVANAPNVLWPISEQPLASESPGNLAIIYRQYVFVICTRSSFVYLHLCGSYKHMGKGYYLIQPEFKLCNYRRLFVENHLIFVIFVAMMLATY
jgi:hypothetical protein